MSYIYSSIIEVLLIVPFFWYNDIRRIKYCIKNKMNEDKGIIKYRPLWGYQGYNTAENINNANNQDKINNKNNNNEEQIIKEI